MKFNNDYFVNLQKLYLPLKNLPACQSGYMQHCNKAVISAISKLANGLASFFKLQHLTRGGLGLMGNDIR